MGSRLKKEENVDNQAGAEHSWVHDTIFSTFDFLNAIIKKF